MAGKLLRKWLKLGQNWPIFDSGLLTNGLRILVVGIGSRCSLPEPVRHLGEARAALGAPVTGRTILRPRALPWAP
ncbi:hypothetical protein [Oryza sativa Japonica Group]|uniref:Uncharacterized protein OJ1116_H09.20 n=1 Tax=Oryza sativa subsp. japonica TaxID=39947 RepID=Q5N8L0_ORYSJ|nr:hypothetical protein [Oryza sativa Japonica Group]